MTSLNHFRNYLVNDVLHTRCSNKEADREEFIPRYYVASLHIT